jgi:hypothetical protein
MLSSYKKWCGTVLINRALNSGTGDGNFSWAFRQEARRNEGGQGSEERHDWMADDLKDLVIQYKEVYAKANGEPFPTGKFIFTFPSNYIFLIISYSFIKINLLWNSCADPKKQLSLAVLAVFDLWDNPYAKNYDSINK